MKGGPVYVGLDPDPASNEPTLFSEEICKELLKDLPKNYYCITVWMTDKKYSTKITLMENHEYDDSYLVTQKTENSDD